MATINQHNASSSSSTELQELYELPQRLHMLLNSVEFNPGQTSIVSWVNNGTAFQVHLPDRFMTEIAPRYFSTVNNFQTFQCYLSLWGFHTIAQGLAPSNQWFHPLFQRSAPEDCKKMSIQQQQQQHSNVVSIGQNITQNNAADFSSANLNQAISSLAASALGGTANATDSQSFNSDNQLISSLFLALLGGSNNGALAAPQQGVIPAMNILQQLQVGTQPTQQQAPNAEASTAEGDSDQAAEIDGRKIPARPSVQAVGTLSKSNAREEEEAEPSDFNSFILKSKAAREAILQRGSRIIPCRARAMPMDHSSNTAFFEIPPGIRHGTELICSYPSCRNGGVKFLYCLYCDAPVSRRTFKTQHAHQDQQKEKLPSVPVSSSTGSIASKKRPAQEDAASPSNHDNMAGSSRSAQEASDPSRKRRALKSKEETSIVGVPNEAPLARAGDLPAPEGAVAQALAQGQGQGQGQGNVEAQVEGAAVENNVQGNVAHEIPSESSDVSSSSTNNGNDGGAPSRQQDSVSIRRAAPPARIRAEQDEQDRISRWQALLQERVHAESAENLSAWLSRVIEVSEIPYPNNIPDDLTKRNP